VPDVNDTVQNSNVERPARPPCAEIQRRIRMARFPVIKTLDQFNWTWPKEINRLQVKNLFRLGFIGDRSNVIFLGGVGLGKTHLASALGYTACLKGYTVLFATAVDTINTLVAAQAAGRLKQELKSTPGRHFCASTSWAFCPSTRPVPTCSSRSSACAMSRALW